MDSYIFCILKIRLYIYIFFFFLIYSAVCVLSPQVDLSFLSSSKYFSLVYTHHWNWITFTCTVRVFWNLERLTVALAHFTDVGIEVGGPKELLFCIQDRCRSCTLAVQMLGCHPVNLQQNQGPVCEKIFPFIYVLHPYDAFLTSWSFVYLFLHCIHVFLWVSWWSGYVYLWISSGIWWTYTLLHLSKKHSMLRLLILDL